MVSLDSPRIAMASLLTKNITARAKRQAAQNSENGVTTQSAAMTNEAGDVIAFDSANVYLDSVAKGL